MERAVYAQCWMPRSHCYHPSLPPRRLKMVEDFSSYRATMLSWPALGGGGISLPYLEAEAYEPVTPRYRQYGFLNDSEFVRECHDRGVQAFSVIFCLQGWEFPAEFSESEDEVLALNELRGAGKRGWLGLREFTQNRYPKIWKPFEHYFPDGLTNSAGEQVTDLWEECTSRDITGAPIHADWLECPDREHACYLMDSNNPVWREYLKAIIRIHIDAGVDGIQFDEPDGPISALRYGGCFCRDCMTGFRRYLAGLPAEQVPAGIRPLIPDFHYGEHLRALGHSRIEPREPDFLTRAYAEFQRQCTAANLRDLIGYARSYARSAGRRVRLSANVFDGLPCFAPLAGDLDVLVPEQRHTLYRQPSWMRYIAGFGEGKPVAVSVNPYGGVLPELAVALREGQGLGHFRGMLYEAAALGVTMSVPYGAWMGSIIEDAFYAPHEATVQIQDFLADHEFLYGPESFNETAVVFSVQSNFIPVTLGSLIHGEDRGGPPASPWGIQTPFTTTADALADDQHPFDVLMFHDGHLAADGVDIATLAAYRQLVLPGCSALTATQVSTLLEYLDLGGQVLVVGEIGPASTQLDALLGHRATRRIDAGEFISSALGSRQVALTGVGDAAVNVQRSGRDTAALHVVRYLPRSPAAGDDSPRGGGSTGDGLAACLDVTVLARLPYPSTGAVLYAPGQPEQTLPVLTESTTTRVVLPELGQYGIVEFLR